MSDAEAGQETGESSRVEGRVPETDHVEAGVEEHGHHGDDEDPKPAPSLREGRIEHFVRRMTGRDARGLKVSEIDDILVRYARCCNPLPGDEIVGFITRGRGITVHRRDCAKAFETDPERRVAVTWDSRVKSNRSVQLKVLTANRPGVLARMGKPEREALERFKEAFDRENRRQGKEQFLTYYLIAAHPGCGEREMRRLRDYASRVLKITPEQVQVFTPTPSTYSTLMYYTGRDPWSGERLFVERSPRRKENQKRVVTGSCRARGRGGSRRK